MEDYRDALLAIDPFMTRCEKDCLNDLFRDNYYRYCTIHAFNLVAINYLKPSTALSMPRTSDLQDFNRETICGQGGTTIGSHAWSRGTICGSHIRSGETDYGGPSIA